MANKDSKPGFGIPDQSIVKAAPAEGSAAWMKQITKEHGDTAPQKLEKRRERLSALAAAMDRGLKQFQMAKKVFITRNQKMQDAAVKKLSGLTEGSPDFTQVSEYVANLQLERQSQEQQFDLLIDQKITNMAMVEGLCLLVDCTSLREPVKSKNGKIGMLRFSSALYNCDAAYYSTKAYNRLKKLFDLMAAQNPLLAGVVQNDEDEEEDGVQEYEDDDVVTEDDRKQIKKDLEESDDL